MHALPREFYDRPVIEVARDLLGKILVRRSRCGATWGRIVEVEAYLPENDPACHASRGRTRSNEAMFGPAGCAYVYPIHSRYCLNAVTERPGAACAVLIRAVEPLSGVALMRRRRGIDKRVDLARGPGRLCEAFGIDRRLDHWDLTIARRLWISEQRGEPLDESSIAKSARIGVTSAHDLPLRFFVSGSPFVSGPRHVRASDQRLRAP